MLKVKRKYQYYGLDDSEVNLDKILKSITIFNDETKKFRLTPDAVALYDDWLFPLSFTTSFSMKDYILSMGPKDSMIKDVCFDLGPVNRINWDHLTN